MKTPTRIIAAFVSLALLALPALAQKYPPAVQKALDVMLKHVNQLPNGKGGDVTPQNAPAVKQVFPDHQMVIVRYRIYPVARAMPEGFKPSNLFAVDKEGKFEHLKDVKTMQKFFHTHHAAAKSEKDAKSVLAAWMTLTQEFHQDGVFTFEIQEKQFAVAQDVGLNARGRLIVMKGGNGDLIAELDYGPDGQLAKVNETVKIKPGPRPICQATKLLDADP